VLEGVGIDFAALERFVRLGIVVERDRFDLEALLGRLSRDDAPDVFILAAHDADLDRLVFGKASPVLSNEASAPVWDGYRKIGCAGRSTNASYRVTAGKTLADVPPFADTNFHKIRRLLNPAGFIDRGSQKCFQHRKIAYQMSCA
jgi:hypothetical protein